MSSQPAAGQTGMTTLAVPGASLRYEVHGEGPLLALVGHPMGIDDLRGLARALAGSRTVLLHDPRGFGGSPLVDPSDDADPAVLADDLAALVREAGGGPVEVVGTSGGAVTALAFAQRHHDLVAAVVAHEPPLVGVLPDEAELRARTDEVVRILHEQGPGPAFGAFMALAGFDGPPAPDDEPDEQPDEGQPPSEEEMAAGYRMLAHGLVPICTWEPDDTALRAVDGRLVLAGGADSAPTQLARRAPEALASRLGAVFVELPGDHAPFVERMGGDPAPFAAAVRDVLDRAQR
ncbi:alpha/beta fold hydrolase [Aquipuribacter nitratireducens]|uniref:Alpha/beta fold hydrolase n=1 Tax=Aquipuribacter nitratireducens TaxID=650104 RepID=A0ABW0GNY2_9MICO